MRVQMCKPQGKERIFLPSHNLNLSSYYTTRGSVQYMTNKGRSAVTQ